MPGDPTPVESTRDEPSATDRAVCDRVVDTTEETDSGKPSTPPSDASETASDGQRNASDPGSEREAALERRVTELEAELEAVRGLLDGVEAVDETVDERASTALAKVEALEERLEPEEGRLVRERLPDAGDSGARERVRSDQRNRQRDDPSDSESDPETGSGEAGSRVRDANVQNRGRRTGTPNSLGNRARASTGTVGTVRNPPTDGNAADEGSDGSGVISGVGSAAPDREIETGDDDTEQSLAARLRDAFR